MPILDFTTPVYCKDSFEYAIARKAEPNPNQYMLIFSRAYGMAATRNLATLNYSTTARAIEAPKLSPAGRPLIWIDSDIDRIPGSLGPASGDMLSALLQASRPLIRPTGRTRMMIAQPGGARIAHEVEILLEEDELAHMCGYCGCPELAEPDRFKRYGGSDARPEYICFTCDGLSAAKRTLQWTVRRYWFGELE